MGAWAVITVEDHSVGGRSPETPSLRTSLPKRGYSGGWLPHPQQVRSSGLSLFSFTPGPHSNHPSTGKTD